MPKALLTSASRRSGSPIPAWSMETCHIAVFDRGGAYSFVTWLSHWTIDHASSSRRSMGVYSGRARVSRRSRQDVDFCEYETAAMPITIVLRKQRFPPGRQCTTIVRQQPTPASNSAVATSNASISDNNNTHNTIFNTSNKYTNDTRTNTTTSTTPPPPHTPLPSRSQARKTAYLGGRLSMRSSCRHGLVRTRKR